MTTEEHLVPAHGRDQHLDSWVKEQVHVHVSLAMHQGASPCTTCKSCNACINAHSMYYILVLGKPISIGAGDTEKVLNQHLLLYYFVYKHLPSSCGKQVVLPYRTRMLVHYVNTQHPMGVHLDL